MELDRPREVKFHQSANRHNMLMGGDRELVLLSALLSAILIFSIGKWWGIPLGITLWLVSVAIFSRLGKADPLMRQVYIRHIKYQASYPAKAGVLREAQGTRKKW